MLICVNNPLLLTVCCTVVSLLCSVFRTNLPKEVMMFPDFPFDSRLPSFLTHWDVQRYLEKYCKSHDITPHIKVFKQRPSCLLFPSIFYKLQNTVYNIFKHSVSFFVFRTHRNCNSVHYVLTSLSTG